ncbi:MAG: hypothetical protein JST39_22735, partial [Bacteroidetes bacterium]|nr:hypothetical protein [Bacteroidota bacterium]
MINLSAGERSRMGRSGRQLVSEKFGVEKIIKEYEQIVGKIVKRET